MKLNSIITATFIITIIALAINIYAVNNKNFRVENGLLFVLVPQLLFIIAAGYQVNTSNRIHKSEKTLWIVGFVLTGLIAGTAYMLSGRRRVAPAA